MWYRTVGGLVTLLLSLLAVPSAADAQQRGKVYRIGYLRLGPAPSEAEWQQSPFLQELRQLGYVEGQNIVIEQRYAAGQREQLPASITGRPLLTAPHDGRVLDRPLPQALRALASHRGSSGGDGMIEARIALCNSLEV